MSDNYRYVIDRAVALAASESPAILDYGCGAGQVVALGLEQGLDIRGADPYAGSYDKYHHRMKSEAAADVQGRIHKIENGRLPFADASFDVVLNVEASHCYPDFARFLAEVSRVLRKGGHFAYADFRFTDEITAWESDLAGCGLRQVRSREINAEVLRGMEKNATRSAALIARHLPGFLQSLGRDFAGIPGSRIHAALAEGRLSYRSYLFAKEV